MSDARRPLRIAHLAFTALPATVGGLEIVVDSLIRHQMAAGHDVTLVTRWKQCRALRAAAFPYPVLSLPPNPKLSSRPFGPVGPRWPVAATLRWHQWRHRFDLWHVHWVYPTGWMTHPTLERAGVPTLMTAHGADLQVEPSTGYGYRLCAKHDRRVRELVPNVRWLTAISPSIEAAYLNLGAAPANVYRIPNGVDARRIAARRADVAAVRRRLGVTPGTSLVLSVGRNQPSKGFQFIPEALAHLLEGGHELVWAIVGKDSGDLLGLAERWGVEARMRLLPPMRGDPGESPEFPPAELVDLYHSADVFAFPSLMESFGMVAVEAMAAGLPVVASDVPGLRDVVVDGTDGLLFRPGDPASMAEAISRALRGDQVRERLVANARKKASAHDWQTITARYLDLYRRIVTEMGDDRAG